MVQTAKRRSVGAFAMQTLSRLRQLRREMVERKAIGGSGLFDPDWYHAANPDVAASGRDPLTHYLRTGAREGRWPSPWFDADWYLARNTDLSAERQTPLAHYVLYGHTEGREPNPVFNGRWYLANNPLARSEPTPLSHYVRAGAAASRDPAPEFDAVWYAAQNPEAAKAGLDPLAHYLLFGRKAGRRTSSFVISAEAGRPVAAARLECVKALGPLAGETVALFAAYAPGGLLKPHVVAYVEALAQLGVRVVLVVATDQPLALDPALLERLAGAYVRENQGYDFAAWSHVMRAEPALFAARMLLLVNDSLIGPSSVAALKVVFARVEESAADVVGLADNYEHGWHLQSFFIALKQRALSSVQVQAFFGTVRSLEDKAQVIRAYEVRLTSALQAAGMRCEALFPSGDAANPTVAHWRELIADGFPFVKTLTLRAEDAAGAPWREILGEAGFDVAVAEAALAASAPTTRPRGEMGLLRAPLAPIPPARPWKVAFIGPWNFGTGLGHASRGYLSALWRLPLRLNLHPIEHAFHTHARLGPGVRVRDFEGHADVAIIHLHPDAWHLLGEAEREVIERARFRAGLWVWEMGAMPDNWRPNFGKVDAIWSPSQYCADIFRAAGAARVDLVPHVVPLPPDADDHDEARRGVLAGLGYGPEARLILYAFDGASYLVRKNPDALIRAFVASGLAARGWRLVLKAKNLMDRPAEGAALAALAATDPAIRLIDRSLSRDELAALFAAADIYASPHRSEGFGLTIAEAMAAGKSVVASDFAGPRDFLDQTCGYPVPTRAVRLDRDFGHYTKGGVWGEVDEAAFAEALRQAAARIEAGDHAMGIRARARIGERLSAAGVAKAMAAALDGLIEGQTKVDAA